MQKKFFMSLAAILILSIPFVIWQWWPKKEIVEVPVQLQTVNFESLPGWDIANMKRSFKAFQVSCKVFLKQDPEKAVGSPAIALQVKDWLPACKVAMSYSEITAEEAKQFFEKWFKPHAFHNGNPLEGLFTGYYSPLLTGSLTKTEEHTVPIYGLPKDLVVVKLEQFYPELKHKKVIGRVIDQKLIPYHTREAINKGALKGKAPVLVWLNNRIDRVFLEIQGSGSVALPNGETVYLGYEGENGAPYTSVAKVLIDKGIMTKHNASMQAIRKYLDEKPEKADEVLHQNKSFVFFRKLKDNAAYGAQGAPLVAGYSLAVDRQWIPLGTPIWLTTTRPDEKADNKTPFRRLMVAQDTGGAIRGPVRGDVYWGAGEKATFIAGHMKNAGFYWLLLPAHVSVNA